MKPHTDDLPDIPRDPTVISDSELMELYSTFTSWQNYLDTQLTEVEAHFNKEEHFYEYIKGQRWKDLQGSATDKRITIEGNKDVDVARQDVRKAQEAVNLIKAELRSAERNANLMSRELSRRIGRKDRGWGV